MRKEDPGCAAGNDVGGRPRWKSEPPVIVRNQLPLLGWQPECWGLAVKYGLQNGSAGGAVVAEMIREKTRAAKDRWVGRGDGNACDDLRMPPPRAEYGARRCNHD